jgi:uncharacterized protein YggE
MKVRIKFLAMAATLAGPVGLAQQPAPVLPLVSTSGSAEIRVVPDLADLYFEVEVRNADLSIARKQQAERASKVLAALRAAGVIEAELQSSQVRIRPDYTEGRQETETIRFFSVGQGISCTLHDVTKVPEVTASAVTAGATGVREASLRTSQLRKHRDEARSKAIQAAKEKAIALATELGAKVGKPYAITEGSGDDWRSMASNLNAQVTAAGSEQPGDGTTPTFAPGTISISASISVSFHLE